MNHRTKIGVMNNSILKIKLHYTLILAFMCPMALLKSEQLFDGHLALVEIVEAHPVNPDQKKEPGVQYLLHKMVGKVIEVYDGSSDIIGVQFPLATPRYHLGKPEEMTFFGDFEGVAASDHVDVGSRVVTTFLHRRDYDVNNRNFNPWRFPYRSIFFPLNERPDLLYFDTWTPEFHTIHKEWGTWIKSLNTLEEQELRIAHMKSGIASENSLIAISAVHLFKRLYPDDADLHFLKIIFSPGTRFLARLAIDHEFCLSNEKDWVAGGQKQLQPILFEQSKHEDQGEEHLQFRELMLANGSWFGRPADME